MDVATSNGWQLYAFAYFLQTLRELIEEVKKQQAKDPLGFYTHPSVAMLRDIRKATYDLVPADPGHKDFRQGKTLGDNHRHWRRVKNGLPNRYRLFFRYNSAHPKAIIYAWMNDKSTLRKAGAKTDVYAVFQKMLDGNKVPSDWKELLDESASLSDVESAAKEPA